MHRFFAGDESFSRDLVVLTGTDASHICTVLRLQTGDKIQVLDGKGSLYVVQLTDIKTKLVKGEIISSEKVNTESPLTIHLGQSLIKGNKFDVILRKSVELGAKTITPLMTERTVVKNDGNKKIARWQKIAEESCKQCGRSSIPNVSESIIRLDMFCRQGSEADLKLMFWELESENGLKDINPKKTPSSVSVLIGPEGGFTIEEVKTARSHGFQTVSLGPRILRAETAPLVVLSLLQFKWGDI
jgi:16S rRNA (uracil1498-N3)-methyltransferase